MVASIHAVNPHDGGYDVVVREGLTETLIGTLWGPDEDNGLWVFESTPERDAYHVVPSKDIALLLAFTSYKGEVTQ